MKIGTAAIAAVIGLTMAAVGTANAVGFHGTGTGTNIVAVNGTTVTTNGLGFGHGTTGAATTTPITGTADNTGT
ncbi:MAG TPA: hypothetical protein VNT26_21935, partial [Candidatus Sulfotelmatobacter sp.]|nr:hypothetical protein [Candidatus Sulfotelmatobacter sp.]